MTIHLDSCCFNQRLVLISKTWIKRVTWQIAESYLLLLWMTFVPSIATFNQATSPSSSAQCSYLQGLCCHGNRHPLRHPMTAQGERRIGRKGSKLWPCAFSRVHQNAAFSPAHPYIKLSCKDTNMRSKCIEPWRAKGHKSKTIKYLKIFDSRNWPQGATCLWPPQGCPSYTPLHLLYSIIFLDKLYLSRYINVATLYFNLTVFCLKETLLCYI